MDWIIVLALSLLAIGSFGVIGATVMEYLSRGPLWELLMKIFPWVFGLGAVLFAYWLVKQGG